MLLFKTCTISTRDYVVNFSLRNSQMKQCYKKKTTCTADRTTILNSIGKSALQTKAARENSLNSVL